MACCWKSIYKGLKKCKTWKVTVWNIMVQGHRSFGTVSNLSVEFVFIEAVVRWCFVKKFFLEISENWQENTRAFFW